MLARPLAAREPQETHHAHFDARRLRTPDRRHLLLDGRAREDALVRDGVARLETEVRDAQPVRLERPQLRGRLPEARHRGFGRALTLAPLLEARHRQYQLGILQSSEMGLSLYSKIGFKKCCEFQRYFWTPE